MAIALFSHFEIRPTFKRKDLAKLILTYHKIILLKNNFRFTWLQLNAFNDVLLSIIRWLPLLLQGFGGIDNMWPGQSSVFNPVGWYHCLLYFLVFPKQNSTPTHYLMFSLIKNMLVLDNNLKLKDSPIRGVFLETFFSDTQRPIHHFKMISIAVTWKLLCLKLKNGSKW